LKKNNDCPNQASRPLFRESVKRRTLSETETAERKLATPFFDKISRARMLHFKEKVTGFSAEK
jgi:hypothetical protein